MPSDVVPLPDDEELLFRQVHPNFVRDGRPSSQSFRPTVKDAGKLSVARGSLTTPAAAYELYTAALGLPSAGTWALSVGECREQILNVLPDPLTSPPEKVADPAHAVIDFAPYSKSQAEAKGARLARKAVERGRLYPAFTSVPSDDSEIEASRG
jgi:hypothetical protein